MESACSHHPFVTPVPVFSVAAAGDPDREPMFVISNLIPAGDRSAHRGATAIRFLRFAGELDCYSGRHVGHVLSGLTHGADVVVIDASAVTFIDGDGLRVLEDVCNPAAAPHVRVRLHEPSRVVRRLIDLIGIGHRFDTCHRSCAADRPSARHRKFWPVPQLAVRAVNATS